MMPKHDFYSDPTVFDHWQNNAERWFLSRLAKLAPFSWFTAFTGLALVFVLLAMGVFVYLLQYKLGGAQTQGWNQSMAQGVMVIVALLASQHLFQLAVDALPGNAILPSRIQGLLDLVGEPGAPRAVHVSSVTNNSRGTTRNTEPSAQEFFAGVRAAGVNVRIARSLFAAGIRSPQQLLAYEDARLLEVRGIGPATVRKLRNHFERTGTNI